MTDQPFPKNPYVIGVPLTGDFGFYGRRAVFTFVEDTLNTEQQNVLVLYGQRRVGKTSLLHQLVKQLTGEVLPIYFDLQSRAQQSLGQVLYELARTVARPLKMSVSEQAKFDNAGRFFREEFLPSVYQLLGKRRLLLLFDEFDVLGDELTSPEAASETLFPYLQSLIMHERQIVFIFVVGRRIEELATHFQAIFKQAVYRRVGLLKPEDATTLIVEPVKEVLTFEESAIEAILNLTAGHPYFTQLICSELFNAMKANNQHTVAEADVLKLVNQAIESGHGALNWFWDGLPRAERFIMSAVAHVTDETGLASKEAIRQILEKYRIILTGLELTDAPDKLVEWEMLRREGPDNYRFVVELVRRWIIKMHPLESARRDVDFISQRAVRSYENAREAHSADDLEYAHDEYRRALTANPNHSGAQLGLAQVLFELGQIEAAIEEFSKAYALDEMSARDGLVQAYLALGKKLEEAKQPNEAILQYEHAYKISPNDETTRRRLANIWQERSDIILATEGLGTAFEPYQKALDFDHSNAIAEKIRLKLNDYIHQAETDQKYDQAIKAVEQLQKLGLINKGEEESRLAAILLERGHLTLATADLRGAVDAYQQALTFDRPETITRSIHAKLEAYAQQAQANQNYDEAIQALDQLKKLLPENETECNRRLALLWLSQGNTTLATAGRVAAAESYQKALELDPSETLTEEIKAQFEAYAKQAETAQNYAEAIEAIQQLRKLLPKSEAALDLEIAFWTRRGDSLAKEEQGAEAIQAYQYAFELNPSDATLTEKLKAVSTEWEKLLETDRLFNKALIAHQAEDWAAAEIGWLQLLKKDVLNYKQHNIAKLLAEASEANQRLGQEPQPLNPIQPPIFSQKRDIQPYIWVVGGVIVVLLLISSIIFSINTEIPTNDATNVANIKDTLSAVAAANLEATKTALAIVSTPTPPPAPNHTPTPSTEAETTMPTVAQATTPPKSIAAVTAEAIKLATVNAQAALATITARAISGSNIPRTTAQATKLAQIQATVTARAISEANISATANAQATKLAQVQATVTSKAQGILFQDDFSSNSNGWWEGDSSREDAYEVTQVTNGKYRMAFRSRQPIATRRYLVPNFSAKDFLLNVEVTILEASGQAEISIIFRGNNNNADYYAVSFGNNDFYLVDLWQNGEWQRSIRHWATSSAINLDEGVSNSFAILVKESNFTIYANGQELTTMTDTTLTEAGQIELGVILSQADQTVRVDFDNLVIKEVQ